MEIPWNGFYHHEARDLFETRGAYLKWYGARPAAMDYGASQKVGIFFPRSLLKKKDLDLVDRLITGLEKRKVFPIAVFAQKQEYGGTDCPDPEENLALLKGVDLIINCEASFLLKRTEAEAVTPTILEALNVPVIQAVHSSSRTKVEWEEDPQGLHPSNQIYWVAQPEFNGTVEPVVVSARGPEDEDPYGRRKPIPERVDFLLDRVLAWLHLGKLPLGERRVTFLLHKSPCAGVEASVAGGAGLDVPESTVGIMQRMAAEGYDVSGCPADGKALIDLIMGKKAISEFRWTTVEEIVRKGGAIALIDPGKYEGWFSKLPAGVRKKMIDGWGDPPGEGMVYDGNIVVTGINFGNVNVLVEPKRGCYGARCDGKVCKILHEPTIPPTHQCLATYQWAQENSDVLVSVGTHGYIEFLPGKGVGLSNECFPEIVVGPKPHLYVYAAKNSSEGVLAKRRAYATIIDHLGPVMRTTRLYDALEDMDDLLGQYARARDLGEENRRDVIWGKLLASARENHLSEEALETDPTRFISMLHEKLNLIRETRFGYGLHILGRPPDEDRMPHMLAAVIRFEGTRPSIRRLILELMGHDYEEIIRHPEEKIQNLTSGEILTRSADLALELIRRGLGDMRRIREDILRVVDVKNPDKIDPLIELLKWAVQSLAPKLRMTEREIPQVLRGMDKQYIEPGPSGLLTRGKTDILPTGRNFYSVDTRTVPTQAAWEVGVKMAQTVLHKYLHQEKNYPENVGMVLWAIDTYRADGEQIAQILYLMGVRPVWSESGIVTGTEPIPLKELKRPRIDVTIRTSGIFRDNLPHLIGLIDGAIRQVADLNERDDYNFIRKHVNQYKKKEMAQPGEPHDMKKVEREATYRLFSAKPGAYGGGGVGLMIAASAWKDTRDLGEQYIDKGGYAYGKGAWGEMSHKEYAHRLSTVDVTYHKLASDESDPLGCCSFYDFQGGMVSAVKTVSGNDPKVYWGDTSDPQHPRTADMKDEMAKIVRTGLLNPQWIEGMKQHGYKGASDIAKRVGRVYGWDASAEVVADWIFDDITTTFVLNEENRKFFEKNNPWALEEMSRRLLEAEKRGVWNAKPDVLSGLRERYLEIEGWMEADMGEAGEDFQGGNIDVMTREDVQEWSRKGRYFRENTE